MHSVEYYAYINLTRVFSKTSLYCTFLFTYLKSEANEKRLIWY